MQLLVRFKQHDRARTYLRWLLLLFFAMPHTKTYKISAWQIFYLWPTIVMGCSGFVTFHSGMSPWGYRGLSWFHCTWHETLYMRHMMLRKEGATACKISIKQTCNMTDLRWFSRFLPSASHQEYRLADLYLWPIQKYLPNNPEKHPMTTETPKWRYYQFRHLMNL